MEYNINYCIVSAAYISITALFYSRQVKIPSRRTRLFDAMLCCCLLSLALDILAAGIDRAAYAMPAWLIYAVNITFLATAQSSGVLFFLYCINLTGTYRRMSRAVRALILLPFFLVVALLLLSPLTDSGIFYLDRSNVYHHGALHMALYAVMGLYIVSSVVIISIRRKKLQRVKFYTILAFLLATVSAMLVQMRHPYLLVNSMANAFALTLMYHILEAPSTHMDALTEVLNRTALPPVLRDLYDEGERCTALVYSLNSLHLVNHSFGMKGGDAALHAFAAYLKRSFPRRNIFRAEGNVFCVLLTGGKAMEAEQLRRIWEHTPRDFDIGSATAPLSLSLCGVNSEDCGSAGELTALLESVIHRPCESFLLVGKDFRAEQQRSEAIEKATERAMDENRVQVYLQPIHQPSGRLCAIEALVRVTDPELGFLPPQELVELAERNGSIIRLGEQVLRRTCEFIRDTGAASWGLDHIGVNLSAVQCARPELARELMGVIGEYGIAPGLIAFEITETAAGALATVRENMETLQEQGVYFLLDDFGTGYANFKNMAALPYRCVKIDKSLLWDAQDSPIRMKLLSGVVKVIHALGLTSLCEGVETAEQVELLRSLGVEMLQGYYFSKPLSPQAFVEYAGRGEAG